MTSESAGAGSATADIGFMSKIGAGFMIDGSLMRKIFRWAENGSMRGMGTRVFVNLLLVTDT
jgi:hypothetical protein